jgi:hypothetical protein
MSVIHLNMTAFTDRIGLIHLFLPFTASVGLIAQ